jgi:protein TonB
MSEIPTLPVVDDAERFLAQRAKPARGRLALAALAAVLIEAGVVGLVAWEHDPAPTPQAVEIPIEIIPEPPPEPPPPPPEPQAQADTPPPQELEKPATDAPREGKSDHDDSETAEKEKPAAAPPPPAPTPSSEPSPPAEAAAPELPKAQEPDAPAPVKTETPKAAAPPKPAVTAALPKTFEDVPNVDFGGAAIRSPVTGGAAKSNYLSQLYGLIVPRLHVPAVAHAYGRALQGAVAFQVDGRGRLLQRYVVQPSGSTELDQAAMEAVATASKSFPAPPRNAPIGMKFTYSVN